MREKQNVLRILTSHFFRRFFDNDTVQVDGDTTTTVVRAIAIVAVPGLMIAFFLQPAYSAVPGRPLWAAIQDQYFFVLFSFVVMGAAAIFEWEMMFPDRLDFLILSPLSVKPVQMLAAKAGALVGFLALFLVSANVFGAVVLPAVSKGNFYRQVYAHGVAVGMAGLFAALFFLALGGVMLCVLSAAQFRTISPVVQMGSVLVLVLLLLHYLKFGDAMRTMLGEPLGVSRWVPPFWFLGVYEWLLRGDAAPAFAQVMAGYGLRATAIAAVVVVVTYPVAWARMRRMAVEGASNGRMRPTRWVAALLHRLVRQPAERAVFHFIGQTMARNNRYQVYLAMYGATGLALAVACAVTFRAEGGRMWPGVSNMGLHAVMPLLLFWVIAGLRTAFAFPLNLSAGWVYRISGVDVNACAAAGRRWVLVCAAGVAFSILIALRLAGMGVRPLLVQSVCGLCLCVLLTDGFFVLEKSVPFNKPRMPGRANFPLMLTLYVGVLSPFVFGVIYVEMEVEKSLTKLVFLAAGTGLIHAGIALLNDKPAEIEEEMEGYEGEFQLLGLS